MLMAANNDFFEYEFLTRCNILQVQMELVLLLFEQG